MIIMSVRRLAPIPIMVLLPIEMALTYTGLGSRGPDGTFQNMSAKDDILREL